MTVNNCVTQNPPKVIKDTSPDFLYLKMFHACGINKKALTKSATPNKNSALRIGRLVFNRFLP